MFWRHFVKPNWQASTHDIVSLSRWKAHCHLRMMLLEQSKATYTKNFTIFFTTNKIAKFLLIFIWTYYWQFDTIFFYLLLTIYHINGWKFFCKFFVTFRFGSNAITLYLSHNFFFFNHSHFLNLKLFLIYFIQCLRSKVVFYNSEFQSLRAIA